MQNQLLVPNNFCWATKIVILGSPAKATAAKMLSFIPPLILLLNKSDNATKVHPILCVGVIVFNATSNIAHTLNLED
jgi:hypothetical protein